MKEFIPLSSLAESIDKEDTLPLVEDPRQAGRMKGGDSLTSIKGVQSNKSLPLMFTPSVIFS